MTMDTSSPTDSSHQVLGKSFFQNPIFIIIGATLLFICANLFSVVAVEGLGTLDKTQKLFLLGVGNLVFLLLILNFLKRRIRFSWKSIGFVKPARKYVWYVIPAVFVYFIASMMLTSIAMKLLTNFDVNQSQDIGFDQSLQSLGLIYAFLTLVIITPIF